MNNWFRFPITTTRRSGYIAIATVLVIAAIVVTVGTSTSLLSIGEIQSSLSGAKSNQSIGIVEGCVEDALLRLNEDGAIPTQIPLPEGTCDVTIDAQSGSDWTFTTSATVDSHTKSIQVTTSRSGSISITSWQENN